MFQLNKLSLISLEFLLDDLLVILVCYWICKSRIKINIQVLVYQFYQTKRVIHFMGHTCCWLGLRAAVRDARETPRHR